MVCLVVLLGCTTPARTSSPTPAPVSTAPIVFATASPVAVQTPPIPTPIPPPTTPTQRIVVPTPAPAGPRPLFVANTGGEGLALRGSPTSGGERIAVLPEGTPLTPTGQEEQADGRRWRQVKDPQGREGWVAADFLTASLPAASLPVPSPDAGSAPPPTQIITLPPPPPTPTRQPTRVPGTSAPVTPSTAKPQAPAVVVPSIGTRFSPPASPTPR